MIFKTITTDLNGSINKIGIFNRSFADLKNVISINGIGGLFNSISPTITSKDLSNIKEYNRLVSVEGVSSQTAWYRTMLSSSKAAQSLFDDEKNLIKTNNGLVLSEKTMTQATNTMTLSAKAATVATKALAIAGNMIAMWAITKGISIAVEKINDFIHSVDKAKEAAGDALSTINDSNSSIKSNGEWIESNISSYEKLSKGIDALGRNVSLTDEEFQEYNSLTNEIAEMFPTLVTGYTNTGDAILSCKNNVDLLTQAYEDQKQAAQDAVFQNSQTLFKGFKADTTDRNIFSNGMLSKSDELDIVNDLLSGKKVANSHYANQVSITLKNAGIELSNFNLTAEKLNAAVSQNQKTLYSYARTLEAYMESATSNITPIIDAYLDTNIDFNKNNKYDEETQAYIKQIADNMGYRFYSEFESEAALVNWIDSVLVPAFEDVDSQDLLSNLFTLDKDSIPVSQYIEEVNYIIDQIVEKIGGDANQTTAWF